MASLWVQDSSLLPGLLLLGALGVDVEFDVA